MRTPARLSLALLAVALLAGCAWVGEERAHAMRKEWQQFTITSFTDIGADVTGFTELFPSPQAKEQAAEQRICLHPNSRNRIVTQNGVNDELAYRRCPLAPYDTQGGSRMGIRPDANPLDYRTVVR